MKHYEFVEPLNAAPYQQATLGSLLKTTSVEDVDPTKLKVPVQPEPCYTLSFFNGAVRVKSLASSIVQAGLSSVSIVVNVGISDFQRTLERTIKVFNSNDVFTFLRQTPLGTSWPAEKLIIALMSYMIDQPVQLAETRINELLERCVLSVRDVSEEMVSLFRTLMSAYEPRQTDAYTPVSTSQRMSFATEMLLFAREVCSRQRGLGEHIRHGYCHAIVTQGTCGKPVFVIRVESDQVVTAVRNLGFVEPPGSDAIGGYMPINYPHGPRIAEDPFFPELPWLPLALRTSGSTVTAIWKMLHIADAVGFDTADLREAFRVARSRRLVPDDQLVRLCTAASHWNGVEFGKGDLPAAVAWTMSALKKLGEAVAACNRLAVQPSGLTAIDSNESRSFKLRTQLSTATKRLMESTPADLLRFQADNDSTHSLRNIHQFKPDEVAERINRLNTVHGGQVVRTAFAHAGKVVIELAKPIEVVGIFFGDDEYYVETEEYAGRVFQNESLVRFISFTNWPTDEGEFARLEAYASYSAAKITYANHSNINVTHVCQGNLSLARRRLTSKNNAPHISDIVDLLSSYNLNSAYVGTASKLFQPGILRELEPGMDQSGGRLVLGKMSAISHILRPTSTKAMKF